MKRLNAITFGTALVCMALVGCRTAQPELSYGNRAGLMSPTARGRTQAPLRTGPAATETQAANAGSPVPRGSAMRISTTAPSAGASETKTDHSGHDEIRPVAYRTEPTASVSRQTADSPETGFETDVSSSPQFETADRERASLPIDLATALQLSGADTWQVELARARAREAAASYHLARLAWVPDVNLGVAFNHHDGDLQATEGDVETISRTSLFVGGGAALGGFPLAGGAGGPPRLAVSVSVADAWFGPLVARQRLQAAQAQTDSVRLEMQRSAGSAYLNLVDAVAKYAAAVEDQRDAERALSSVNAFVAAGKGANADIDQMQVFARDRQQAAIRREAEVVLAANRLATAINLDLTQLDPTLPLIPAETAPAPIALVDQALDPMEHVRRALANRPELADLQARLCAADQQKRAEHWRPFLPHVQVGTSAGAFGGGTGSTVNKLDGRSDFDVIMAWQLKNLGAGNRNLVAQRDAQHSQLEMTYNATRDRIVNEVLDAWTRLNSASQQLALSEQNLNQAQSLVEQTVSRVRELQSGPLDLIQALGTLSQARLQHIQSLTEFNQRQLDLMLATGNE